jgi:hypothetical protein
MFLTQMVNTRKGGGIDLPPNRHTQRIFSQPNSCSSDEDDATDGRHHGGYARADAAGTPGDASRARGDTPGIALGARGDTLGEKGATAIAVVASTSTPASTSTTSSTPGQAPRVHEP